jgi:hypothetical protein
MAAQMVANGCSHIRNDLHHYLDVSATRKSCGEYHKF